MGTISFLLAFACGIGFLPALLAVPLCIVGLMQVGKHREQSGQGLAIAGLALSGFAILISLVIFVAFALPMIKAHELTVTEQTSNDSD